MSQPPFSTSSTAKPPPPHPRILSCIRCQQRKIKCNRVFPCSHCTSSKEECVQAAVMPRGMRRKRFPERELLERVRVYEELLKKNGVCFEGAFGNDDRKGESIREGGGGRGEGDVNVMDTGEEEGGRVYEARSFWQALNSGRRDSETSSSSIDEMQEVVVRKGWVQLFGHNDHLLLFSQPSQPSASLSSLHPSPVHIFRLWQVYLDNINPLLKITHTPTLQVEIIEAVGEIEKVDGNLDQGVEALLFSIYCVSVLSLGDEECWAVFGEGKKDLEGRWRWGCRQALMSCNFLRAGDRVTLTALYLYLLSVRSTTVVQSLSSILGIALRIAKRLGIHSESSLSNHTVFEAEMRRRLWWSLMLFDTRISELSSTPSATLDPTWDCKLPLNINDSDLRPEMKELPIYSGGNAEGVFTVVRNEVGEFVRKSKFYLSFTNPALIPLLRHSKSTYLEDPINTLETHLTSKYLQHLDSSIPVHYLTIHWTRTQLSKFRLLNHHFLFPPSIAQTPEQRDTAIMYAITMLHHDTLLTSNTALKPYHWFINLYSPFPAYIQLVQDLRSRPNSQFAEKAWEAMSMHFEGRWVGRGEKEGGVMEKIGEPETVFIDAFRRMVLGAWEVKEKLFLKEEMGKYAGKSRLNIPGIVVELRKRGMRAEKREKGPAGKSRSQEPEGEQVNSATTVDAIDAVFLTPTSLMDPTYDGIARVGDNSLGFGLSEMELFPDMSMMGSGVDESIDWTTMNWGFGEGYHGVYGAQL